MRWALIPSWSREAKLNYATFNAKAETINTAASFRGAGKAGHRCLVVADGFYEWRKSNKQPFVIACASGKLTIIAGYARHDARLSTALRAFSAASRSSGE